MKTPALAGGTAPIAKRAALRLAQHAVHILPPSRRAWGRAMLAETDYIDSGFSAFGWALGVVAASYLMGVRRMTGSPFALSSWVLVLEMSLCFAPLALFFAAVVQIGLLLPVVGARPFDPLFIVAFGSSLLGPLGLALAAAVIFRPASTPRAWLPAAVVGIAIINFVAMAIRLPTSVDWEPAFLIGLIPLVGALHLMAIVRHRRQGAERALS